MRESHQPRAVVLALLLVGAAIGGTVPLATAASVSPFTAQTDSQDDFAASVETYDGQIAVEDGVISVSGSSTTDADVVVVFVGARGTVVASALPVTGERFAATVDVAEIEEGFVDGVVLSSGNDETFGTPGDGPDSADDLVDYADDLGDRDLTQDQVREVLLEATVNGGGSDDNLVDVPFVLTEGDVRITDVVPASDRQASGVQQVPTGEPMVVRGVTNRRPSGRLIEATLVDSDGDAVDVATVDDWDTDGVWSVELAVPDDATPDTYTVVADDGEQSVRVDVKIVAASAPSTVTATTTATAEPTTTAGPTSTATATPTQTTAVAGSEPTPEPTPDPTTTETQSPGLGLLVALGALAVAALTLVGLREKRT